MEKVRKRDRDADGGTELGHGKSRPRIGRAVFYTYGVLTFWFSGVFVLAGLTVLTYAVVSLWLFGAAYAAGSLQSVVGGLKDQRGSAAVEMAFVMPIVLLILVGMIQYGSIFYTQHMMVYAAREVARSFSMGEITATQAQARALELLAPSGPKQFNVSVAETGGVINDVTITIGLPRVDAALINLPINLITGNVTASVTMRVL